MKSKNYPFPITHSTDQRANIQLSKLFIFLEKIVYDSVTIQMMMMTYTFIFTHLVINFG